jgi:branched-chain amino acid transport system substrate-binding protein
MAELHKDRISDMITPSGTIRRDGLMEHEMYITQVKLPAESKHPFDYYKLETMSGYQVFKKLSDSTCPLSQGVMYETSRHDRARVAPTAKRPKACFN